MNAIETILVVVAIIAIVSGTVSILLPTVLRDRRSRERAGKAGLSLWAAGILAISGLMLIVAVQLGSVLAVLAVLPLTLISGAVLLARVRFRA
jgi:hypothetical protein